MGTIRPAGKIRHIAITAEDPFVTAELFKSALGLEEISRGDSELAREVYLTDGYINLAIVCWKRTKETPNPYPDGYGLDHFGLQVVDLSKLSGNTIFFEKKLELAGVKFDLSGHGWAVKK